MLYRVNRLPLFCVAIVVFLYAALCASVSFADTCDSIRYAEDNTEQITLTNMIVTAVRGSSIYIQDDDRCAAAQIDGVTNIVPGNRVDVTGTISTLETGERSITGTVTKHVTGEDPPKPIAMTLKNVVGGPKGNNPFIAGSGGLNNYAMLVRVAGKVTSIGSGENQGMFYIADGSGLTDGTVWNGQANTGLRVVSAQSVTLGQFVTVTGISSVFKNNNELCRVIYGPQAAGRQLFTAYNDLVYIPNTLSADYLKPNVTSYGTSGTQTKTGFLKDYSTGNALPVTATVSASLSSTPAGSTLGGDLNCAAGTDAATIFGGIVSLNGIYGPGSTSGWNVDVEISGLDPAGSYEYVTTGNRNDSSYASRATKFSISGADSFANTSSTGVTFSGPTDATATFSVWYNTVRGYVARWTNIKPGPDGKFTVRAEGLSANKYNAYGPAVFMIRQID